VLEGRDTSDPSPLSRFGYRLARGRRRQIGKRWATYPANFCPVLFGGEFTKFGFDFGEAVGYSIEYLQRIAVGVGPGSAKHFQDMLSDLECMKGAAEIGVVSDRVSRCSSGRWQEMPGLGASGAKFTL